MMTLKCKCGEEELITFMGSYDCQGCIKCNTTFAFTPGEYKELKPHKWLTIYNSSTGKSYKRCEVCFELDIESYKESRKEYAKEQQHT